MTHTITIPSLEKLQEMLNDESIGLGLREHLASVIETHIGYALDTAKLHKQLETEKA